MRNQELFSHMSRKHGLTLIESEMHEIELIVARTLAIDREQDAARSGAELRRRVLKLAAAFERRARACEKTYRKDPHAGSSDQGRVAIGCWCSAAKALRSEIDKLPNDPGLPIK